MNYQEFLAQEIKPKNMATTIRNINLGIDGLPMIFICNEAVVFENLDEYSSLCDLLDFTYEKGSFKEVFSQNYPNHKVLALPKGPEEEWDSFYEFALFVDTGSEGCPVVYFNAEYQFEVVASTFELFYASLTKIKS